MKISTSAIKKNSVAEKQTSSNSDFPIVAIGASAGGLEAVSDEAFYDVTGKITGVAPSEIDVTEKVLARNKIEESEKQLQLITDALPVLIAYIDKNRSYRFNNKAYETWFGHSSKEISGKHMKDVLGEAAYNNLKPKIDQVLSGKPVHFEMSVPYKDGGTRWVVADYIPHFGKQNEVLGYYGVVNDVTAIKKAEELNSKLAAIVSSSEDAIISKTLDGIITSWNRGAEKIFGYAEAEMMGEPITKIIPKQRLEEEPGIIENISQGKTVEHFETQRLSKEGKLLDISLTISPIKDSSGKIIGASKIARDITEHIEARKKIEESEKALKEKNSELQDYLDNATIGLHWVNADGILIWANKTEMDLLGYSKDEYIGHHIAEFHADQNVINDVLTRLANHETLNNYEAQMVCKDGSLLDVIINSNVLWAEDKFIHTRCFTHNVTEKKLAEKKIEESEKQLRELSTGLEQKVKQRTAQIEEKNTELQNINKELQEANLQVAISKYNKRFLTEFSDKFSTDKVHDEFFNSLVLYIADLTKIDYILIGKLEEKSKDEFAIQTIAISVFGKLTDNINYPLPDVPCEQVTRGTLYSYPEKCRVTFPKNQTLVEFNVEGYIGYPLFNTLGHAVGLIAVMHESAIADPETVTAILKITAKRAEIEMERIRYEKELEQNNKDLEEKNLTLAENENRIQTIFEAAPDAVITMDHHGIITHWNEEAENIFGWKKDEVIGRTLAGIIIPERYREQHKNGLKNYIRTGERKLIGKPIEIEALKKDNTEIPVELKISTSVVNSNPPVFIGFVRDISSRKKSENEIVQKNKDLENMNKELEAFTYISSHDLQEPLRKIQTFTTLLLQSENQNLSDTGKDYFHRMQQSANRMQTLIQDLLAFSRINTSERKFELTDLSNIIEEVKSEFKETITEKNATIETGDMCEVRVIPFQFRQLIQNLFSNALKFSKPNTPPHIIINSELLASYPALGGREACHITFTDNGIGFEPQFTEKIFQLFQRLHGKDVYAGTGIGLAIVKKIVENHHGVISATSELGNGVRFDIYLPAGQSGIPA